jgi:hypothetical protein
LRHGHFILTQGIEHDIDPDVTAAVEWIRPVVKRVGRFCRRIHDNAVERMAPGEAPALQVRFQRRRQGVAVSLTIKRSETSDREESV